MSRAPPGIAAAYIRQGNSSPKPGYHFKNHQAPKGISNTLHYKKKLVNRAGLKNRFSAILAETFGFYHL
jgi:hypothetical protein